MEEKKKLQPKHKKILGIFFIIVGFLALITPFTPGSWLIFVGLGLLGVHFAFFEKIKGYFINRKKKKEGDAVE
jgi:uncharacterized protein YqgC (DUF456 family)